MNFKICKLQPTAALHLGEREGFLEGTEVFIHSDTLFSAFCHCYLLLYGKDDLEDLLNRFLRSNIPPFLISSAFPWQGDELYFPIPKNQISKEKELKDKMFIEKSGFEQLLSGKKLDELYESGKTKLLPEPDEEKNPWKTTDVPRIGLSRLSNHPGERFFHFGEVHYKKNSGLFFLIQFNDETIKKKFVATINLMSTEGIGGDRSSGKGLFGKPLFEETDLKIPQTNEIVTLSLYHPKENELADITGGYYEIIDRKGYIYSPHCQSLRRKPVRMFTEGSVFISKKIGGLVDVTPQEFTAHKIYRYGFCFSLPCELTKEG